MGVAIDSSWIWTFFVPPPPLSLSLLSDLLTRLPSHPGSPAGAAEVKYKSEAAASLLRGFLRGHI